MTESRRSFVRTLGASAAVLAARPVFAAERTFEFPVPQAGPTLLNYNESPYGASPRALAAVRELAPALVSRYYTDGSYETLRDALAAHHGVTRAHIQMAAGSTEILKVCDDVFLTGGKQVVVAQPAYEAVLQYAANSKADSTLTKLTADWRHDLPKMGAAVNAKTGLVYICNPNNPTGTIVYKDEMAAFMAKLPATTTVLVDEAYAEFTTDPRFESAVKYVKEGRNVIIAKTFSKIHGMAGMRLGYAIAKPDLIAKIAPFTVDFAATGASADAAIASMKDTAHRAMVARNNATERTRFVAEMKKRGLTCADSHANFVLVDIKKPVAPIIAAMKSKNVLVGREFGAMPTFLRVTLGTAAEMNAFYAAFSQVMG
jgi:histidinol-phosphate aminotransferase